MSLSRFLPSNSIRSKIILGYALLFLVLSVFIYTYFPLKYKRQAISAIEFKIEGIIDMMSIGVGIGLGELDIVAIGEVLKWARKDSSLAYIVVLNQDKQQIALYKKGDVPVRVNELLKRSNGFEDHRIVNYTRPLAYQEQSLGTMLIGYSLQALDKDIDQQKETSLSVCLAIFGFGLCLSIAISTRITGNITKLSQVANEIAEGSTHVQVPVSGHDEIGKLTGAFNNMVVKLNGSREALLSSTQYTENIIRSMLDCVLVLDQEANVVRANPAACLLLEYTEPELNGKNIDQFFEQKSFSNSFLPLLRQTGRFQSQESTCIAKSGSPVCILFSAAVLRNSHGSFQGIVCVAQDISERKKAEAQLKEYFHKLEKSNQELEKFNYVVSHDLKAPLSAFYKLSEWIQEDMKDVLSEESRKHFEMMQGRFSRMEALINGLLAYSQTGQLIKLPELVSVEEILREVIQHLAPPDHLSIGIQPGMPTFITQRKRLQLVFKHLLTNAIRFNDKKEGKIWISVTEQRTAEQETYYQFSVEDNGQGIESQYFEKVFVIFQTLHARDRVESTGIGLTIAKKIVEEHHGKIWIDSVLGQGARFSFTWPGES